MVCPANLRSGLFTTSAIDNIDHNPSATSAHDSFHGTGISLFQHPTTDYEGVSRDPQYVTQQHSEVSSKSVMNLPEFYASVPPAILRNVSIHPPETADIQTQFISDDRFQDASCQEKGANVVLYRLNIYMYIIFL